MKVVKSRVFKGAYIIKESNQENEYRKKCLEHIFLEDAKYSNGKMEVQYACYSMHYRKWFQDTMYISKEKYENIRRCANL